MSTPLTLLAVHAHPDDETVSMGGTFARYAAEGVRTVVVTCTRGELATIFEPSLVGQDVGQLREQELASAAQTLGIARLVQMGYGDSGMAGTAHNYRAGAFFAAPLADAAARLVSILNEERPDVVVT